MCAGLVGHASRDVTSLFLAVRDVRCELFPVHPTRRLSLRLHLQKACSLQLQLDRSSIAGPV
jgi:hypothetical protein